MRRRLASRSALAGSVAALAMLYPAAVMAAPTKAVVLGLGGGAAALALVLGVLAAILARRSAANARRAGGLAEELARARAVAGSGGDASLHWLEPGGAGVATAGLARLLD